VSSGCLLPFRFPRWVFDCACTSWSTEAEGSTELLWTRRRQPCQCPASMLLAYILSGTTRTQTSLGSYSLVLQTRYTLLTRWKIILPQSTVTLHGHLVCHFYVARLRRLTTGIEWTLGTDSQRPMDAITNSFCAVSICSSTWSNTWCLNIGWERAWQWDVGECGREPSCNVWW